MKLRVLTDIEFHNLEVIQNVLAGMGGEEVVEFSNGSGAGNLCWSNQNGSNHVVRIAVPLGWLADPAKSDKVAEAARHFASGVRFASGRKS